METVGDPSFSGLFAGSMEPFRADMANLNALATALGAAGTRPAPSDE